jgi:hypothetical protein
MTAASSLSVGRLSIEATIPRDQPVPPGIGGRLEALAREDLISSLAASLAPLCPENDDTVWVIRRLEMEVVLDLAWSRDASGRHWARAFGSALTACLGRGEGGSVLRFRDQASYAARFLRDLVAGRAWGRWYYAPFAELRSLPRSVAIRETLARDPDHAEATLLALAREGGLAAMLAALTGADAARILALSAGESPHVEIAGVAVEQALSLWPQAVAWSREDVEKMPLALLIALRQAIPRLDAAAAAATASALAALVAWLRAMADPRDGLHCIALGESAFGDRELLPRSVLAALAAGSARERLLALATAGPRLAATSAPREPMRMASSHAGLFLLWRSVSALGLEHLFAAGAKDAEHARRLPVLRRSLLAAKLAGGEQAASALGDPALQLIAGNTIPASLGELAQVLRHDSAEAIARTLCAGLPQAPAAGRSLLLERIEQPETRVLLLLREAESDAWLWATYADAKQPWETALSGLRLAAEAAGPLAVILLPPGSEALIEAAGFAAWQSLEANMSGLLLCAPGAAPAQADAITHHRARARPVAADLAHLALPLPPGDGVAKAGELAWTLLARAIYRDLARRLMGFAWSSLPHLHRNFIAGDGLIEIPTGESGRTITVTLPPVPLRMVLRIAGIDGTRFRLPGNPGAEILLALPRE